MADKRVYYRFSIDSFTPETLPLHRLGEYISDLAVLLGNREHVHFVRITKGSATQVIAVQPTAVPKVRERVDSLKRGGAPKDVSKAFGEIDRKLAEDNAVGVLTESRRKVISFPGRTRRVQQAFGPFVQEGTLDGELIKVGGEQETVPVHLEDDGRILICQAKRPLARQLAQHIFGPPLRVFGNGSWERDPNGDWKMHRFTIESFKVLDAASLHEVLGPLRAIDGGLSDVEDPLGELENLRHGNDE